MWTPPLVIRVEQMAVLEDVPLRPWLTQFLTSNYPARAASMGTEALIEFVETALQAARAKRIRDAAAVRKYVHVSFLLGLKFESDPELAWARKILNDPKFRSDLTRLRVLEDETVRHVRRKDGVSGRL